MIRKLLNNSHFGYSTNCFNNIMLIAIAIIAIVSVIIGE